MTDAPIIVGRVKRSETRQIHASCVVAGYASLHPPYGAGNENRDQPNSIMTGTWSEACFQLRLSRNTCARARAPTSGGVTQI